MSGVRADVDELVREIDGPGNGGRKSVRTRLHDLETFNYAEKTAEAATSSLKAQIAALSATRERRLAWIIGAAITLGNVLISHFHF